MKRAIINLSAAFVLGLGLAVTVLAILSPDSLAAPDNLQQSPLVNLESAVARLGPNNWQTDPPPPARPLAAESVQIENSFDADPRPGQDVTIPFNNLSSSSGNLVLNNFTIDGYSFTGNGYNASKGTASVVNGRLVISHTNGNVDPNNQNNQHYAFFLNQEAPNASIVEVTILTAATFADFARVGLDLRGLGPVSDPVNDSSDGSNRVYFGLQWASSPQNFRLFGASRVDSSRQNDYDSLGLRVAPNQFPVRLRITRSGNTFTFAYTSTAVTDFTALHTFTNTNVGDLPYITFFTSNENTNTDSNNFSQTIFDDLHFVHPPYTIPAQIDPAWIPQTFGSNTSPFEQTINDSGQLVLTSKGAGAKGDPIGNPDGTSGYAIFYRQNPVATQDNLDVMIQLHDIGSNEGAIAGLELRQEIVFGRAGKVNFGIRRNGGQLQLHAFYRLHEAFNIVDISTINIPTPITDVPMWLRITRDPGTNTFHFYYLQRAGSTYPTPTDNWQEMVYATAGLNTINLPADLYVALFNAAGSTTTAGSSKFDNFRLTNQEIPITGLAIEHTPAVPLETTVFSATINEGSNVTYAWNFGDGNTGSGQTINHTYATTGTFTVYLTATNNLTSVVITKSVTSEHKPISGLALTVFPQPAAYLNPIQFIATIDQGTGVTYDWRFAQVTATTAESVVVFTNDLPEGTYTAWVTASNGLNSQTVIETFDIELIPDEAISGLTVQNSGPTPFLATTIFTANIATGENVRFQWNFGDGTVTGIPQTAQETPHVVNHTYSAPGSYTVIVTASNNTGLFGAKTASTQVIVVGEPKLTITKEGPVSVAPNDLVTYTITTTNIGNDVAKNLVISDVLPFRGNYVANSGGTLNNGIVNWTVPELKAGESITAEFAVTSAVLVQLFNRNYEVSGTDRGETKTVSAQGAEIVQTVVENPPIAEAGPLQVVAPSDPVTLDGTASREPLGRPLTYQWRQIAGDTVLLNNANTPTPSFIASPQVGDLIFQLTVANENGLIDTDVTTVTVTFDPFLLIEKQAPPVANPDTEVTYRLTISNIGTAPANQVVITDVLPAGANYLSGGTLDGNRVIWTVDTLGRDEQISVTMVVSAAANSEPLINQDYAARSTEGVVAQGDPIMTRINKQPTANAGPDQIVLRGAPVKLDGRGSADPDDDALTYAWSRESGPSVSLNGADTARPTFDAPNQFGDIVFKLTVSDEYGLVSTDLVTVTVENWTMVVGKSVTISCNDTQLQLENKDALRVVDDNGVAIYIGSREISANNRNPIVTKFVNGRQEWCQENYDTTEIDSRGYGLLWNGGNLLYSVFSSLGTGANGTDLREHSTAGWLIRFNDASPGGSNRVEVSYLAKLNFDSGGPESATFLTSIDVAEKTNYLEVTELGFSTDQSQVTVQADAGRSPRRAEPDNFLLDKTGLFCSGSPPYDYTISLNVNLSQALASSAPRCFEQTTPPAEVTIIGPSTAQISQTYEYNLVVSPTNAAPLFYSWSPEPSSGQATEKATYTWPTPGQQIISVLITNSEGLVSDTQVITVIEETIAPTQVTINGPLTGTLNTRDTFSATVSPAGVSLPLTYDWSPAPATGQGTADVSYNWSTVGQQTIVLTVSNQGGAVTSQKVVNIVPPVAPTGVTIIGPANGILSTTYNFSATVSPADVSQPISYTWSPAPASGQGTTNVTYLWTVSGTQTITLTVSNAGGLITGVHTIEIIPPVLQARIDGATTLVNTSVTIPVLENDTATPGNTLTLVSVNSPQHGTAVIQGDTVVYTPTTDYVGSDSFSYTITEGQGENRSATVTIIVTAVEEQLTVIPVEPTEETTLMLTDTVNGVVVSTTIQLPSGVYTSAFVLVHKPLTGTTHQPPANHEAAGRLFILEAYIGDQVQQPFNFNPPLSLTLTYEDEDVANLKEDTLHVRYWNETTQQWSAEGITTLSLDTTLNRITVSIAHLTEFGLFGELNRPTGVYYLPVIFKN